jgi:hypothetical protein
MNLDDCLCRCPSIVLHPRRHNHIAASAQLFPGCFIELISCADVKRAGNYCDMLARWVRMRRNLVERRVAHSLPIQSRSWKHPFSAPQSRPPKGPQAELVLMRFFSCFLDWLNNGYQFPALVRRGDLQSAATALSKIINHTATFSECS